MFNRVIGSCLAVGLGVFVVACSSDDDDNGTPGTTFSITSPAFKSGEKIPDEYTCIGKEFPFSGMPPVDHTSPELNWTAGPAGTQSYAIVFRDVTLTTGDMIDERGYHWSIYNIPAGVRSLPKGLKSGNPIEGVADAKQYSGALFNDGYIGPCPSWGVAEGSPLLGMDPPPVQHTDQYTMTVYAMPEATITEPEMRPAPGEGEPPISYVKDLDDYFAANALGKAQLATNSDAVPAKFAVPPAP